MEGSTTTVVVGLGEEKLRRREVDDGYRDF